MKKVLFALTLIAATLFAQPDAAPVDPAVAAAAAKAKALADAAERAKKAEDDAKALQRAYAKEFAFLKAQKESLGDQLQSIKKRNADNIATAKKDVDALESTLLDFELKIDLAQEKLVKAQQNEQGAIDSTAIIDGTITQAKATLDPYGIMLKAEKEQSYSDQMAAIFERTGQLVKELGSVRKESGSFYLPNGSKTEGEIIKIGNIAAYGVSPQATGALAPAGSGHHKLWTAPEATETAKMLGENKIPSPMHLFIYESLKKEVEYAEEKSILQIVDDGGIIGWIIVWLGALGLLLTILRFFLLGSAGSRTDSMTALINEKMQSGTVKDAMEAIEGKKGSVARVLKATLRNIDRDRAHLEDIIAENMLNEGSRLDRYGSIVLVFAAVAPLLGLLGTVTGMIATFDIITEYGTGDPKLLAGGISIALVTTELGLIVAIPLLLLGNLLSGWANGIKDKMEQSALSIVNQYKKSL